MTARESGALDALALQADQLGAPPAADDPAAAPPIDAESPNLGLIVVALTALREASCLMLEVTSPRLTLTEPAIAQCAAVLAPVADKYGLNFGMQFGPELGAALVAGPILWSFYTQLNNELKARKAKPVKDAPPGEASSSSSSDATPA